jgi:hypothetical protein
MKHDVERDERDVEDMRKDNTLIIPEPRRAKRGHGVRVGGASSQDNATTGPSRPNDGIFGDNQQS